VSIFGIFSVGREGLLSQQRAMNTTSNNIANANTPGYTRQRAVFVPTIPGYGADGLPLGGGVRVDEVERVADAALDAQLLRERQDLAFDERMHTGLSRIETIFQELDDTGVSFAMREFFQSIQDLSSNPSGTTERQTVIETALTVTERIRENDRRLDQLQTEANLSIEQLTGEVNEISQEIADLNERIRMAEVSGQTAGALRDTRQNALSELGERVDFTAFERDDGQVAVFVGGGFLLVDGALAGQLEVRTRGAGSDPEFFEIYQNIAGAVSGPITSAISSGEIGAQLQIRDSTVPSIRAQLDEFAFTLATEFNNRHDDGYGLVDNTQRDFFDPLGGVPGAASQITVSATIIGEPGHIAAAGAEDGAGNPGAPGDNVNALNMARLENDVVTFPVSGQTRSIPEFYDGLTGTIGADTQSARRGVEKQSLVVSELEARRGAISGVSIDEEVTNLIRYERAYQASARVISTVDQLLELLLSM
jgi:flagellar hook-associated protein 1 FlgK